jgi:hypothetical protein
MVQIPEKHQILWETALFGLLYRINQGLRSRTPFEEFKKYIAKGLPPGIELPGDKTLDHLYERATDANADRVWIRAIHKIAKSKSWKEHMDRLDAAIIPAQQLVLILKTNDRLLPKRDAQQAKLVARSVERLRGRFCEIRRWDKRLDQVSKTRNWNAALLQARVAMDRILQRDCSRLNQAQRADLIRLAVEAAGLKEVETMDAVARQLSRVRERKKKIDARVQPRSRPKRGTRFLRARTRK